jgi:hypothetical protein
MDPVCYGAAVLAAGFEHLRSKGSHRVSGTLPISRYLVEVAPAMAPQVPRDCGHTHGGVSGIAWIRSCLRYVVDAPTTDTRQFSEGRLAESIAK